MNRTAISLVCAVLMALACMMQASSAFAHASLIASEPANDAVLASSPARLTLTFNEPVTPLVMRLIAYDDAIEFANVTTDGSQLVLTPSRMLTDGAYILNWRVVSADGHPVGGAVVFAVGADVRAVAAARDETVSSRAVAIWLARVVVYAALFAGVGGVFFLNWIAVSGALTRQVSPVLSGLIGAGLLALAISVGLQGLDRGDLPFAAMGDAGTWLSGFKGGFGISVVLAAVAMLLALVAVRWGAKYQALLALILAGASLAASGHAAHAPPRWLMMPAVALHGMALAFWLGALLPLAAALSDLSRSDAVLRNFSRWITFPVAVLAVTGGLLAVVQVETPAALLVSSYGSVLLVKLTLVALLLALAAWNRWRLTPHVHRGEARAACLMRRSIMTEMVLVVAILGAVALWRFTPPPRALAAEQSTISVHAHTEKVLAVITLTPDRAGRVTVTAELTAPGGAALTTTEVNLSLSRATPRWMPPPSGR